MYYFFYTFVKNITLSNEKKHKLTTEQLKKIKESKLKLVKNGDVIIKDKND
jgi:ABC-type tungstate transport system permease subunit